MLLASCFQQRIQVRYDKRYDGFRFDVYCSKHGGPKKLYANVRYSKHLKDYESVWGKVKSEKELVHYLLKYSYTENWEREVRENYLALTLEEFKKRIPESYQVTYFDHFTLPYIAWQIKNEFGIDFKTPTHLKIILKKI